MIQPGKYKARVLNYSVTLSKTGNPQVAIAFNVYTTEDCSLGVEMNWWGSLHAGAKKFTLEALEVLGLRSPNHLALLPKGKSGGALDTNRLVQVTVDIREGKKFPEIRYINPIGFKEAIDETEFEKFLATSGLKAEFVQLAQEKKIEMIDETYGDSKVEEEDPFMGVF